MKIRTLIIEDEQHALARMKKLLKNFSDIEVVGEAMDGQAAITMINDLRPDLVFLDIQLPQYTGFEVLDHVKYKPSVIFVTAYNQYAIKAFEENAIDYVLKPTSIERLGKAIAKVIQIEQKIDKRVIKLLKAAMATQDYLLRFTVKCGNEILIIPVNKVYWIKAEDKYLFINTFDQEYIYDSSLKKLEQILDPEQFFRIHKSAIIAQNKIAKIVKSFTGKYLLKLEDKNKSSFEIGRTYLPQLRKKLMF